MRKEVYLVDEGILLTKEDREFEAYSNVYDKKYGYYDEAQYYVSSLEQAIRNAELCMKHGVIGTYVVVSKTAIHDAYSVDETPVEGETYSLDSVVYSVVKTDDGVVKDFFDKDFTIEQSGCVEEAER